MRPTAPRARRLKRRRLLGARDLSGSYAMLAYRTDAVARTADRLRAVRPAERLPARADDPRPIPAAARLARAVGGHLPPGGRRAAEDREPAGIELLNGVCDELDRRGIIAVEAYPEGVADPWLPSPGPASVYEAAGFERVAGDERFPVYRRELTGETDADAWSDLLRAPTPDEGDDWPLPLPPKGDPDDLFRLPPEGPKRPNPFGED